MPMILVTPLSAVVSAIDVHKPSHLVTLLSPEHMIETPAGLDPGRHLRLGVNDIVDASAGDAPPASHHIERLIAFGREWDASSPLLVHCWAGVSRSMAAAYTLLCDRLGPGCELELALALRARAPHAYPNRLIIRLADEALGRGGHMVSAVEAMGASTIVDEGLVVQLPLVLEHA